MTRSAPRICPSKCNGGYAERQRRLTEYEKAQIPKDVLEAAKTGLQYCTYCDAVWGYSGDYRNLYGFLEGDKFERYSPG